jgi:hypothetical protein
MIAQRDSDAYRTLDRSPEVFDRPTHGGTCSGHLLLSPRLLCQANRLHTCVHFGPRGLFTPLKSGNSGVASQYRLLLLGHLFADSRVMRAAVHHDSRLGLCQLAKDFPIDPIHQTPVCLRFSDQIPHLGMLGNRRCEVVNRLAEFRWNYGRLYLFSLWSRHYFFSPFVL